MKWRAIGWILKTRRAWRVNVIGSHAVCPFCQAAIPLRGIVFMDHLAAEGRLARYFRVPAGVASPTGDEDPGR